MLLYHFRTVSTNSTHAQKTKVKFSPECEVALAQALESRDKLVAVLEQCFETNSTNPEAVMTMLDQYLPHLLKMNEEYFESGKDVYSSIKYQWTSTIFSDRMACFTATKFPDEVAHTVFLYAIAQYQLAHNAHKDITEEETKDNTAHLKSTVARLKTAAGAFDWVEEYVKDKTRSAGISIDTFPGVCHALSMLCLTNAQEFSIIVAVQRKTGWSLVSKLALAVEENFRQIQKTLGNSLLGKYHSVDLRFREYCVQKSHIYSALSRLYLARNANDNSEYGECVGFYESSKRILNRMRFPSIQSDSLNDVKKELQKHKVVVNREYAAAKKDNDTVYYKSVTRPDDLEFPESKFIVKAEPFHVEASDLSYFVKEE